MKIFTRLVYQYDKEMDCYVLKDEDHYEYEGPIAHCGGGQSGGGGGTTQTIQKSDPWEGQQPYLTRGFEKAGQYLDSPPTQYYTGESVVPFSPETQEGLLAQTMRAVGGSPVNEAASRLTSDTLNGKYMYGNPGFDAAFKAASNQIIPMVSSQFEKAGRSNSGLAQTAMTQALGDAFSGMYQNERQNQYRAGLLAPQLASQDYQDIGQLLSVGATEEALRGGYQQNAQNQYYYNQQSPLNQLMNYMGLIQGNYGGTTTGSQTSDAAASSSNPLLGGLGGAMSGYSLASSLPASFGINPLFGAGLGLLGGIF